MLWSVCYPFALICPSVLSYSQNKWNIPSQLFVIIAAVALMVQVVVNAFSAVDFDLLSDVEISANGKYCIFPYW